MPWSGPRRCEQRDHEAHRDVPSVREEQHALRRGCLLLVFARQRLHSSQRACLLQFVEVSLQGRTASAATHVVHDGPRNLPSSLRRIFLLPGATKRHCRMCMAISSQMRPLLTVLPDRRGQAARLHLRLRLCWHFEPSVLVHLCALLYCICILKAFVCV